MKNKNGNLKQHSRVLLWDIETSPNVGLFWRPGYNISVGHNAIVDERKIITIAWKWLGEKEVYSLTWDKNKSDLSLLKKFTDVANEADILVAHYGDRFDLPWFRARCLLSGLDPIPQYKTVDTKTWASKNFYFNANNLEYLGRALGFGGKTKTDFDWWKKIALFNDRKCLALMEKYNRRDVVLLEKVYNKLSAYCAPKIHVGVNAGLDKWTCPRTGTTDVITNKKRVTAKGTVQWQMKSKIDGTYFTISDTAHREFLEAKKKENKKA